MPEVITRFPPDPVPGDDLGNAKRTRCWEIDEKTGALILQGFLHLGKLFSASKVAQSNADSMYAKREDLSIYPIRWSTLDNLDAISIDDVVEMDAFHADMMAHVRGHYDSGNTLKDQVRAANTIQEVDDVEDTR